MQPLAEQKIPGVERRQSKSDILREKLRADEVVLPEEVGEAQVEVAKAVANKFFLEQGNKTHELALRNPAVLLDNMSEWEFQQLPEDTQNKIRIAAEVSLGILRARYGKVLDQYMSPRGTDFGTEIAAPVSTLQRMVSTGEFPRAAQKQLAVIINDLGLAFEQAMKTGKEKGWGEVTNADRLNYYAGNAAAGSQFVPGQSR